MLNAFFNVAYKGNNWFDGLEVMEHKDCTEIMNTYPVVYVNLRGLEFGDFSDFLRDFGDLMKEVFTQHGYLLDSGVSPNLLKDFRTVYDGTSDKVILKNSIKNLTILLEQYHGKKAIVLIDEYDNAINNSYGTDVQKDIIDFMKGLFHKSLKDNDSLKLGVITGIMQIAKENIFSGLNNMYVNNIFSTSFDEYFGFTESEVKEMLTYYGHPEKMDEVREWYDGYRFGSADIYNPWSILNYMSTGCIPKTYWVNEGNPSLIYESVRSNGPDALRILTDIYNDGIFTGTVNENMVFADLSNMEGLLSLLTGSGYLKAVSRDEDLWDFSLVNKEVKKGLIKQLAENRWSKMYINNISRAILDGDIVILRKAFSNSLDTTVDSKITRDERYYQAFMLGLINCLTYEYYIRSEYRGGKGYADITIIPRDGKGSFAVIELKDELPDTDDDSMQSSADTAIEHIYQQRYFADLHGKLESYGIATRQTDVFISHRTLDR